MILNTGGGQFLAVDASKQLALYQFDPQQPGLYRGSMGYVIIGPPPATSDFQPVITSPADKDFLIFDGADWKNRPFALDDLPAAAPAAGMRSVIGRDNGDTAAAWKDSLDSTNPVTIAAGDVASPGTSLICARRDHQHASPATWPPSAHSVLSHDDTTAGTVARGDILTGQGATPKIARLAKGAALSIVSMDAAATDVAFQTIATLGIQASGYIVATPTTKTVKTSGGDYTTIQSALDWAAAVLPLAAITIDVDAGTWAITSALTMTGVALGGRITLRGDTRTSAGVYKAATGSIVNNGDGTGTITASAAPSSGWSDNTDKILITGATTGANNGLFPVVSRSGAAITYTNAAVAGEAVTAQTYIVYAPNRIIRSSSGVNLLSLTQTPGFNLSGFIMQIGSGNGHAVYLTNDSAITITKCLFIGAATANYAAIYCNQNSVASNDAAQTVSIYNWDYGAFFNVGSKGILDYVLFAVGQYGLTCLMHSTARTTLAYYFGWTGRGVSIARHSSADVQSSTVQNCTTGIYAASNSYVYGKSTVAGMSGNTTNYSPATSDTEGNVSAIIYYT